MSKTEQVLELVKGMTVLELAGLVKAFESEFGVSAAAMVGAPAAGGAAAVAEVEEEKEQTEFDVILTHAGDQKIAVIKAVKEITGVGLKEAKDIVDAAPKAIKEKVSRQEADSVKSKLAAVGASAEVK
ncbi:MAG: 50S ribosomal protein L7/L12 [Bacillota bacterium]|nr:50S ribosomal protein L7/L12 [Bacillota bacterium]